MIILLLYRQTDGNVTVFDYTKANFEAMNGYITIVDFSCCYLSSDVEYV